MPDTLCPLTATAGSELDSTVATSNFGQGSAGMSNGGGHVTSRRLKGDVFVQHKDHSLIEACNPMEEGGFDLQRSAAS